MVIWDMGNPNQFPLLQVYFGFTHCPDICPDELDKMAEIIDKVREATKGENVFLPVFITCDPARDSPEVLRAYLKEFHPGIVGLTGTYDQIKHVCRQYRVYFSTPKNVKPGEDYLVDHSIYFYLMGKTDYSIVLPQGADRRLQIPTMTLWSVSVAKTPPSLRPRLSWTISTTGSGKASLSRWSEHRMLRCMYGMYYITANRIPCSVSLAIVWR